MRKAAPETVGAHGRAPTSPRDGFRRVSGAAFASQPSPQPPSAKRAQPRTHGTSRSCTRASTTCATSSLAIPRDKLTVITGVSGSGKSTVAFDILFAEGQRRYLESLNAYARQFVEPAGRADVDAVYGIPPTVAIEQRTSRGGRKSTVATLTEIYHFLRLLFVKLGVQHCPDCGVADRRAEPRRDSREGHEALPRQAHLAARAARDRPQGLLHRARRLGVEPRLRDAARRRRSSRRRTRWPRLDRFKEHDIELPVAEIDVRPAAGRELAAALAQAAQARPQHGARAADGPAPTAGRALLDRARVPVAAAAASSRSIRACSRTTRATVGAPSATAPASSSPASTTSRAARRPRGQEADGRCRQPARRAAGRRLKPEALAVQFKAETSPSSRRARSRTSLAYVQEAEARGARARDRARRDAASS